MITPGRVQDIYLQTYLQPFQPWLTRDDVTEIMVNRPGEVWIEAAGQAEFERIQAPHIDDAAIQRLAVQVARTTAQGISRESPLLAAILPSGERVQIVAPPAAPHWTLAIRRHIMSDLPLEAFDPAGGSVAAPGLNLDHRQDELAPSTALRDAVKARKTILISGGTSSGKTTFLNALLTHVPQSERIITVEDTPEIRVSQANVVSLTAVKGDLGEARITVDDLLQASLRLRPDRLIVGEIRGREAGTFLRAINTGHAGSFTTVHANSPSSALEQVALMVMQGGLTLSRSETIAYCRSQIDVIVQLSRRGGRRWVTEIAWLDEPMT
jgi:type IV secretion system protein VirB11